MLQGEKLMITITLVSVSLDREPKVVTSRCCHSWPILVTQEVRLHSSRPATRNGFGGSGMVDKISVK